MDKFDRHSIFDVQFKLTSDDGVEDEFVFKPLYGGDFVKAFSLMAKLSKKEMGDDSSAAEAFDEETLSALVDLETKMVSQSYPDMPKDKVDRFVAANCFNLVEPLTKAVMKVSKVEGRRLSKKD